MELIYWYAMGATLVAVMSIVDLYHPVLTQRVMSIDTRIIFYVTFFILAILAAPLLIYPCLNKFKGVEFREAINKALFE